jgi:hypothetical protein
MKAVKIILPIFAFFLLSAILANPVLACPPQSTPTKIHFTITVYLVGYTPGESSIKDNLIRSSGSTIQWITLDGTLVSNSKEIRTVTNILTEKGNGMSNYVDSYTNGIIGTGVIKGVSISKTITVDGSIGTATIFGSGSSDKYNYITETATANWHPTDTPFPTLVLTVTGTFNVHS